MRVVVLILLSAALVAAQSPAAPPLSENRKIEAIIRIVDELKDATFIRNGSEHDCHAAAKHMRDKWNAQRSKIRTAEDFIELAASRSSISGKPYLIRFKDGREIESGTFLREELRKLEPATTSSASR